MRAGWGSVVAAGAFRLDATTIDSSVDVPHYQPAPGLPPPPPTEPLATATPKYVESYSGTRSPRKVPPANKPPQYGSAQSCWSLCQGLGGGRGWTVSEMPSHCARDSVAAGGGLSPRCLLIVPGTRWRQGVDCLRDAFSLCQGLGGGRG